MRIAAIAILVLLTFTGYAQKRQKIDELVVKDTLVFQGGTPLANKVAVSMDGNGTMKWVYLSEITDTITFDSILVNYLYSQHLRVNRDSFTDPAATIASVSDSGFIVECFTCDTIQLLLDSTYNSPFTYNGTGDIVQRDTTLNVGIGTTTPLTPLHVEGGFLQLLDSITLSSNLSFTHEGSLYFGTGIYSNNGGSYKAMGIFSNDGDTTISLVVNSLTTQNELELRPNTIDIFSRNTSNSDVVAISLNPTSLNLFSNTNLVINLPSKADDYVLTSDASGKATWQDPTGYGEMGFGDSTRTIALTQNVFSVVTNSNNTLWSTAAVDLHNVTYSGDSLIIDSAGVYQVNAQLSVEGTNASIIRMGVFINGALACTCTGWQQLSNNLIIQLTYINIDTLNVGDVVQVVITNTANSDDVDAIAGKLTVNKIR